MNDIKNILCKKVPEELVKGHHAKIKVFKEESSKEMTQKFRPDLLED